MLYTTNYKLNKPELNDMVDIDKLNENFDILDDSIIKKSNKNYIVDGGFQVWTDGTNVSPSSLKYGHTMWRNFGAYNTYTQGYDDNLGYTMKVSTSADSQTVRCMHYLDTKTILPQLKGKTMTLSFWVKRHTEGAKGYMAFSNNSIFVDTAPVGEWTKFTKTGVLNYVEGSAGTYDNCVCFLTASATPWNTGDELEIAQVKFEIGDVATDFEHETYDEALRSTRYYYQKNLAGGIVNNFMYSTDESTNTIGITGFGFETMRAIPTTSLEVSTPSGFIATVVTQYVSRDAIGLIYATFKIEEVSILSLYSYTLKNVMLDARIYN